MKIMYFDLCAIPIYLIILVSTFIRKATKGEANRLFICLTVISLITTVADVTLEMISAATPLSAAETVLGNIASYVYFAMRNGTILVYLFFIFAVTRTMYRFHTRTARALIMLPYGVLLFSLALNPFLHEIFIFSAEAGYDRGPGILILYVISLSYFGVGVWYLARCKSFLRLDKWLALMSMYILSLISIGVQFFWENLVIEMFATSVAFLLVILIVLRPEEIADSSVGLPSFQAYETELNKIIKTRQQVQIVVIRFINSRNIRTYLGEELYDKFIVRIAEQLALLCKRERLSWELYYERPGTIYLTVDNMDFELESGIDTLYKEMRANTQDIAARGVKFEPRICLIRIPEDISGYEDILHLGHEFIGLVPYERIFSKASDIMGHKDYRVKSHIDGILVDAINKGHLEMYYQPIYSTADERFISAEALIRLTDDRFGSISPGIFIPEAESRGLILPIGDFVLDSVFRFISEIDFEGLGLSYIELNLSVAQCLQIGLSEKIRGFSEKYGVPPERVNLEITETTYDDIGGLLDRNLQELSELGYKFSLDDYGTGYSNIRRVSRLPLSLIKIDKSLVDEFNTTDGMTILANTIRMMKGIRKEIVAEGAETREAVEALKLLGCDFIQGFYFAKPMPEADFVEFIKENNGIYKTKG